DLEVQRHVVEVDGVVGAVVEIEAAQEVLVGLAAARVLGGDEAGRRFEQLAGAKQRADLYVGAGNAAFARGDSFADAPLAAAVDIDRRLFRSLLIRGGGYRGVVRRHARPLPSNLR